MGDLLFFLFTERRKIYDIHLDSYVQEDLEPKILFGCSLAQCDCCLAGMSCDLTFGAEGVLFCAFIYSV